MNLILILTILSSDRIVSAQEFFASNNNDLIIAVPLNDCISKNSNSMIFKFFNGTHIIQKMFSGSTTCDESYISAQYFMEGYYTNLQSLTNGNDYYVTESYNSDCSKPYSYTFYTKEGCINNGLTDQFMYIDIHENYVNHIQFSITNEDEMCKTAGKKGMVYMFEQGQCSQYGTGYISTHFKYNRHDCEENATDEMGIALVFLFICLILF